MLPQLLMAPKIPGFPSFRLHPAALGAWVQAFARCPPFLPLSTKPFFFLSFPLPPSPSSSN